jgi:REP element-mobilizing transposase RayT
MSHSYCQILVHAVFSTDGRQHLIPENMEDRLWAYMGATAKKDGLRVIAVGGISNHAHVFFALPATVTLATTMMNLKANSSRWMGEQGIKFSWQKGYGAFSVSSSHVDDVVEYIKNQHEHHKKRSFEEEFIALLKKYGVDYDPRYVFG